MPNSQFELSKKQQQLYDAVRESGRSWSVDEMQEIVQSSAKDWRAVVNQRARMVAIKTSRWDFPMVRCTGLGRGRKAVYEVRRI